MTKDGQGQLILTTDGSTINNTVFEENDSDTSSYSPSEVSDEEDAEDEQSEEEEESEEEESGKDEESEDDLVEKMNRVPYVAVYKTEDQGIKVRVNKPGCEICVGKICLVQRRTRQPTGSAVALN